MNVPVLTEARLYFCCPNGCGHRFYVEHLLDAAHTTAGPWYCDVCGQGWRLTFREGSIDVEKGDMLHRAWVTLEIAPQSEPIRFRVRGTYLGAWDQERVTEGNQFYYDEGTCPTNWLPKVVEVEVGGDRDPHGFAKYVETVPVEEAKDVCRACGVSIDDVDHAAVATVAGLCVNCSRRSIVRMT